MSGVSKKTSRSVNPDLILVSDQYTSGLFHHERDIPSLVNVLMEHIFLSCFTEDLSKTDAYDGHVGDFAMYRIESSISTEGCVQFTKKHQLMYSQELFEFIKGLKSSVDFPIISNISLLENEVQELNSRLLACVGEVKEKLSEFIKNNLEELYKNNI